MSVMGIEVFTSMRFAWYMRTAARNLPGVMPVACLNKRVKWKRLRSALPAISVSDSGSL